MYISIYQINPLRDSSRVRFMPYDSIMEELSEIPLDTYDKVFEGSIPLDTDLNTVMPSEYLEEIFSLFNISSRRPHSFSGHSLSVSDIIGIHAKEGVSYYFCDAIGFRKLHTEKTM